MNNQSRNFTVEEFMERLANDDFGATLPLVLTGLVKTAEDVNHLWFAPGFFCAGWIPLPIEIIENIQWLGYILCNDHKHSLVNITIKEPEAEEAKVFATLVRSVQANNFYFGQTLPIRPVAKHVPDN